MPYVKQERRDKIDAKVNALYATLDLAQPEGELNYAITRLLLTSLGACPRYADFNAVIGVLECAKLEMYRAQVGPYEDEARERNGPL